MDNGLISIIDLVNQKNYSLPKKFWSFFEEIFITVWFFFDRY